MSGFYGGTLPVGVSSVGSGTSSFGDFIKKIATSTGSAGGSAGQDGANGGGGNEGTSTLTLEDVAAGVQEIVVQRRYLAEPVIESFGLRLTEDNEVLAVEQGKLCSFFKVPMGSIILYVNNRFVENNPALYSECAKTLDVRLKCYNAKAMTDLVAQYLDQDNVRFDEVYEKDHIAYGFLSSTHPLHLHWQRRLEKARETKESLKALEFDIENELKEKEGQEAEEAMKLLMQLGAAASDAPGEKEAAGRAPQQQQQGIAGPGVIGKLGLGSIRTVSSIVTDSSFDQGASKKGPQSSFLDELDRDDQQPAGQEGEGDKGQRRSQSRGSSSSSGSDSGSDSSSSGSRSRSSSPRGEGEQQVTLPAEGEAVSDDQLLALIGVAPPAEIDPIAAFLAEQLGGAAEDSASAVAPGYFPPYAMPQPPPIPLFFTPGQDFAPDVLEPIPFLRPKPHYPSDPIPGVGLGTVDQLRSKLEKGLIPDLESRKRRGKASAVALAAALGTGTVKPAQQQPPANSEQNEICRDYRNGYCKFGSGCRFRHISPRKRPRYDDEDRPTGGRRERHRDDRERERERERDRKEKPSSGGAPSSRLEPNPDSGDRRQSRHERHERESRRERGNGEQSRHDRHRDEKREHPREDREGRGRHRGGSRDREDSERRDERRHHKSSRRH